MIRVPVKPELLRWALSRAQLDARRVARRFPRLNEWERGTVKPTLKQLESFAKATHAPIGYLLLPEPPVERVPIPDFRTIANKEVAQPTPDLLDTIYACQQRQEWFRSFAQSNREKELAFVGSLTLDTDVATAASAIREALSFSIERRRELSTWADGLRELVGLADDAGVLVMVSGIVGSDTHRKLDPREFRGFALVDPFAPVVFVNGSDTRSAQMFTLAHELAHVWLGQSALSDAQPKVVAGHRVEHWCNEVAAELLVPLGVLMSEYQKSASVASEMKRLAREFKVSTLVVLRRMFDAGFLGKDEYWKTYDAELDRLLAIPSGSGGGNFYATVPARVGRRFARSVIADTLEGRTLFRDAARMLGFSRMATFDELGKRLGVME